MQKDAEDGYLSDIGFPAFFLFHIFFGQAIFEKNLMDSIVRYMLAVFVLDNYFETSCAGILLFVDFENKARICSVHAGLGASKFPWCQWLCG